ncbi:MAG: AraC family transcriptional regulator [Moraxellaceae bacterium]|jgi:AraC-like DNA-binding protein|nr:AraC family transcriptional regulator [Moraxellaceae bacterium]
MPATDSTPFKITLELASQLLQFGREMGLPLDEALERAGLGVQPLPGQPAFMRGDHFEQMLAIGLRLLQEPLPGLHASRLKMTTVFGLLSFMAQTSSTVGILLESAIRLEPLLGDTGLTRLQHEPGVVRLTWDSRYTHPLVRRHAADFILSAYALAIQVAARPGQRLIEAAHLQHPAPDDPALLKRYLDAFGCPVYFGQPQNALVLPTRALDLPLPSANPQLHDVLQQHARKLMEERNKAPSTADLARSRLHQLLQEGRASRENLAEVLGMTGRTLHRKLKDAGTSYRELLDALRLDKARALLREPGLSIQVVAAHAGFDESPSFTRWFRLHTGRTPSEYREALARGAGDDGAAA